MDFSKIKEILKDGLDILETAAPYLEKLDVPILSDVAQIGRTLTEIGNNIGNRLEELEEVHGTATVERIRELTAKLAQVNDELTASIRNEGP